MRNILGVAIAFGALVFPAAALAQAGGGVGFNPHGSTYSATNGAAAQLRNRSFEPDYWGDVNREDMDRDLAAHEESRERLALADRVAALVDQGQCHAAEELARAERDRAIARNVRLICEEGVGLKPRYRQED